MIENPQTLADIPNTLTGSAGRIWASDVHAVAGSKQRKKQEIALAIDEEGIRIYDVQTSRLVTSYAVSPQALFTCPPCSIQFQKKLGEGKRRRFTYCSFASPKPQIMCFPESPDTQLDFTEEVKATSFQLSQNKNPIVHLDTVLTYGNAEKPLQRAKILAIHEDGLISCYSQDLGNQDWNEHIDARHSTQEAYPKFKVEHAEVLSLAQARKGILKSREDVLAGLDPNVEEHDRRLLLVMSRSILSRDGNDCHPLEIQIFEVKALQAASIGLDTGRRLKEIVALRIPEPNQFKLKTSRIKFHARSGTLYQGSSGALAIYDLTGSAPRLHQELALSKDSSSTCLRLSSELIALTNNNKLSVVDLSFHSLQAERLLAVNEKPSSTSRKSKKQGNVALDRSDIQLLSYFGSLDSIVALQGRKLISVQLSTSTVEDGRSRKRKRKGLLNESVGRGSSSFIVPFSQQKNSNGKIKTLTGQPLAPSTPDHWKQDMDQLNQISTKSDSIDFDKAAISALGLEAKRGGYSSARLMNRSDIDQRKISYILSRVFSATANKESNNESGRNDHYRLEVRMFPPTICGWLILQGVMSQDEIEMSLKQSGALPSHARFAPGSLVHALAEWDTDLDLLSALLASSVPLSSEDLAHVLVVLNLVSPEPVENQKLLTNGKPATNTNNQLTNGTMEDVFPLNSPSPLASSRKDDEYRLNITMKRLYACPSSSVVHALKKVLSTSQLRSLVDALRFEIARSGWLSACEDGQAAKANDTHDDTQLCYIAHLLNCIIDTIGTGTWILNNSISDDLTDTVNTISYMKAEISAALQGTEEATYLKSMLGEILLCGEDSLRLSQPKPAAKPTTNINKNTSSLETPIKPITIPLEEESNLLPLGLRIQPLVSRTKVASGGEILKRSARDIGRLKSRMVGQYSFERIVI